MRKYSSILRQLSFVFLISLMVALVGCPSPSGSGVVGVWDFFTVVPSTGYSEASVVTFKSNGSVRIDYANGTYYQFSYTQDGQNVHVFGENYFNGNGAHVSPANAEWIIAQNSTLTLEDTDTLTGETFQTVHNPSSTISNTTYSTEIGYKR